MTDTEPPAIVKRVDISDLHVAGIDIAEILASAELLTPGDEAINASLADDAPIRIPVVDEDLHLTDLGNSRLLVRTAGKDLRWCGAMPGTGWMTWTGSRWQPDKTKRVVRATARLADTWREMAPAENTDAVLDLEEQKKQKRRAAVLKHATSCESAKSIRSTIELASAHADVVLTRDVFDASPWHFNTPEATYDLHALTRYPPRRSDYITRMAGADLADAGCPVWTSFLNRVMAGDAEMVSFLQRAAGYSMTGRTDEQCLFILYGTGRNGKGTFVNTIRKVLGDYAQWTPISTFVGRRPDQQTNDLAALAGARMVLCAEPKAGAELDEAMIKLVTGGDTVTARFLNQEFFDYVPAFKAWMQTNHRPVIKGVDEGIWSRLRMVPFTVTIPKGERDPLLGDKIAAELPAILRWCLEGLKEWRRIGLAPPKSVIDANEEYRSDMDILADFVTDKCVLGDGEHELNGMLYAGYVEWAKSSGLNPTSHKGFTRAMKLRGFVQSRDDGPKVWSGIRLIVKPRSAMFESRYGDS